MATVQLNRGRIGRAIARFKKRDDGATAIEFAILAVPFFVLLFAILELAIIFYISSALDNAAASAARNIRVGETQSANNNADKQLKAFRAEVCDKMSAFPNCERKLRVIMKKSATNSFSESLAASTSDNELDCTGPRDVVLLRVQYKHPLALPGNLTRLSNSTDGTNSHTISSTTAFRNEPFAASAGTSCGTATADNPTT